MDRLFRLLLPAGVFALGFVVLVYSGLIEKSFYATADRLFFLVGLISLLFPLRFGRGRQFFLILTLLALGAGTYLEWSHYFPGLPAGGLFYGHLTAAVLPLHILLLVWWRERGLLNAWGLTRLIWLLFLPGLIIFLGTFPSLPAHWLWQACFMEIDLPAAGPLPVLPLTAWALSGGALLVRYIRHGAPEDSGFFWVWVMMAAAFFHSADPVLFRLAITGAMLTLVLSLIETGHFLAYRDELTQLPARRALNEQLQKLTGDYAIAMIDVDHFKRFNDRYGHDIGDEVLKMVAARLKKSRGKAYRYGGEEFTLIYPGKTSAEALADAEKTRQGVADSLFTIRKPRRSSPVTSSGQTPDTAPRKTVCVTVSIGLAQRSSRNPNPAAVLKAADKILYKAKKNGRNRVEQSA